MRVSDAMCDGRGHHIPEVTLNVLHMRLGCAFDTHTLRYLLCVHHENITYSNWRDVLKAKSKNPCFRPQREKYKA